MKKDVLELKNGTTIELESGARLEDIVVVSPDKTTMMFIWGELTEINLSEVQVRNEAGITVGRYTDLLLVSETSIIQEDGSIRTSFYLREKTNIEKRIDLLESSQEMQNGAIDDLGAITSALAEAQERKN